MGQAVGFTEDHDEEANGTVNVAKISDSASDLLASWSTGSPILPCSGIHDLAYYRSLPPVISVLFSKSYAPSCGASSTKSLTTRSNDASGLRLAGLYGSCSSGPETQAVLMPVRSAAFRSCSWAATTMTCCVRNPSKRQNNPTCCVSAA